MEAIADRVIEGLGSLASKELELLCNFPNDLDSMKSSVSAIKAVLRDAEVEAPKKELISDWLEKLKDVLLDAEDLLDAYSTEELAREVMTKDKMAKEVRIFFSKLNRIACALKMGHKIKAIRKKLADIVVEKNDLNLNENSPNISIEFNEGEETYSIVWEEDVVGRDEDKKHLVSYLLGSEMKDNVSIVSIVGIGGVGKTTLAQQVYNDKAVQDHFELKMWVCVSDEFNIKKLAQKIIGQENKDEGDQLAQGLRKKVEGKHFLLVLDDVWNEDPEKWRRLKTLLMGGRKGSGIIVTTRSQNVAEIIGTHLLHFLKDLDLENSWKLFCQVAFEDGKEPNNPELVDIGKDIVKKCAGVPLVIRTIGSLLFSRKPEVSEKWSYFRDNELAKIDLGENKMFSTLKLSYDHLPSHLKNCFGFCSLFPKDYVIERKTLIQLWMAEGFIQPLDQNRCMEDVGHEYFMKLLSRCLFQDVSLDEYGDIESCKMHDVIHDLARSVTKNECCIMTRKRIREENFGDRIRHVSSDFDLFWEFPTCNIKTKKVRTIMSSHLSPLRSHDSICGSTTSFPRQLRVLDFSCVDREIPKSIGELKHLRYLDLSWNKTIEKLPQAITKLHNLQTLKLDGCDRLKKLPRDIDKMVSLRHLELDNCLALASLPKAIGNLTSLRNLQLNDCLALASLPESIGSLTSLQGLNLHKCSALASLPESIGSLTSLQNLHLDGCSTLASLPESIGNLTSFRNLQLDGCSALASLPESIGNLTLLQELILLNCFALASLPESIGNLTSLQYLNLDGCCTLASLPVSIESLTSLQGLNLHNCSALASLPESIGNLTSLQYLNLDGCSALASLPESIGSLTSLRGLNLLYCSALASLPESIGNLMSLQYLKHFGRSALASLPESIGNLTSLLHLSLNCSALASLPESIGNLTSLQRLSLFDCFDLASLPESIGSLTSLNLLFLDRCSILASLPESIGNLTSLQSLFFYGCPALASLPESIGNLTSLPHLVLKDCSVLASLPESIGNLTSLQVLSLHNCSALASLPESIGNLMSLQVLDLDNCSVLASLPESIENLPSLQDLDLRGCLALASLPESMRNSRHCRILV